MANIYVRSTTGNNTNSGATWALAKLDLTGAAAIDAAGDSIWVSQAHNESTAGSISPAWAGTLTLPTHITCVDDSSGEPPTVVASTGVVTTSGTTNITLSTGTNYYYGVTFQCGSGAVTVTLTAGTAAAAQHITLENCALRLVASGASAVISLNNVTLVNCGLRFANASQHANIANTTWIYGGSVQSGGTSPTFVFNLVGGTLFCEGFDFSNCSAGVILAASAASTVPIQAHFRNCKLPSLWTGSPIQTVANLHPESVVEMVNCNSTSANYKYWRQTVFGSIRDEVNVFLNATDGVAPISWKMVSVAALGFPNGLKTQDFVIYNSATGSSKTATVELVTDNVTLHNDEIWLEVVYFGDSSSPLTSSVNNRKALVGSNSTLTSSTAAWTTTGLVTPIKQKLAVSFTPNLAGYVIARVYLAKPSATVYVDPVITLT